MRYCIDQRARCNTEPDILNYQPPVYAVEVLYDLFASAEFEEIDPLVPAIKVRIGPIVVTKGL
jgi:hypothetical protein